MLRVILLSLKTGIRMQTEGDNVGRSERSKIMVSLTQIKVEPTAVQWATLQLQERSGFKYRKFPSPAGVL